MAVTFDQIKEVRLALDDPAGFIDLISVDAVGDLPAVGAPQTAYLVVTDKVYKMWDGSAWQFVSLRISDARLTTFIDQLGVEQAIQKGYLAIMQRLGNELQIVRNSDGAESTEFVSLMNLYNFYKSLLKDAQTEQPTKNTGRYVKTKRPCIAGGNL
jgi:hypothetical protein